ncbi:uncharacterized protein LOC132583843 isoform X2 [Heteronotia binoei]|uniref:uncharacterized protein LOC132583843 isoform X2 n=1 Tax=Heteronotia binoei TaxID=13085 RepID=UPI002931B218|nr:uncharacterized protein LOC132583843 isoform X2 [Heteronotia binoei]
MSQIVPKSKAPGADFCGVDKYYYIVRSDLGCYMRANNFNHGYDLEVFSLHTSCWGGDHYLAYEDGSFYIIKGNKYRCVSNMTTDNNAVVVYSLHPSCQGGDHYFSAFGHFYIIFQGRGVYHRVTNLNTDNNAVEYTLHPDCQNGLYYWGIKDYYYFVKPHYEWGIRYYKCTDFHQNLGAVTYSFHGSVVPFIPGGLAINEGPAFGRWEAIKTIFNDTNSPIVWSKITKKVGYKKKKMDSVEQNWEMSAFYEPGALAEAIAKFQFSLPAEYGGEAVQTQQENWSEATEVEESVNVTLQPRSQMYVWQYQLGFGSDPVLFCRALMFTNETTPPTIVPLLPSNK